MSAPALLDGSPRRAPELALGPAVLRGPRTVHLVKDRRTGRFFEVGDKEHFVITRLDGTRTLRGIGAEYAVAYGRALDEKAWSVILGTLWRRSFLDVPGAPAPAPAAPGPLARKSWLTGSLNWGDPEPLLRRLHGRIRWVFSPAVAVVTLLLCAAMLVRLAAGAPGLLRDLPVLYRHPELTVLAGFLLWASSALHEVGHGLWCHHYGGRTTAIGMRWRLPMVMFYCEADDVLLMRSRRHQVATAAVGVVMNLVFLLPFCALWLALPDGDVTHDSLSALLVVGTLRALFNYVPLPGLDGYRMLQHALGTVDLGPQTWTYLRRRRPRGAAPYPARARWLYRGYAALFTVTVLALATGAVLLIARSTSGTTRLLVLAAVALWAAVSLTAGLRRRRRRGTPPPQQPPTGGPDTLPPPRATHRRSSPLVNQQPPHQPVVVVRDLHKSYGDTQAVAGISFTVGKGEFFGILGPNGAGKTTLIEMLAGQRVPDSGTVTVFDESPWPRKLSVYRRLGIQSQASSFFPDLTAIEHLQTMAGLYDLPRTAAAEALAKVDLGGSATVRVDKLSGGQRQRLAIASALVHGPDLLFLDEPTAALDPEARRGLWRLLREIRAQGCSIVCTTHHLDEAEELCDRTAIVQAGRLVALDSPRQLIRAAGGTSRIRIPGELLSCEAAAALPGVLGTRRAGADTEISTESVSEVLAALGAVVDLDQVETRRPTLEDVYLNLTGAEFTR
ncbi:ATP-binding cassette domain-containing protein [Streptomyces sp. NPDC007205]|uniref:ATP-binding cassette domain-containing protein n=1 Tax=Streptomyces sp. NPDC007205 TaxID=3154316 RepID=UPI0033DAAE9B